MKKFPILYKYTSKGQIQQWQIIVDNDSFYTIEGIKDGKLTESLPTYCKSKNIGKKNETSAEQQALKEATSKHQKKIEKGYNEVLTDKKNYFEPMLAENFEERKHLLFTKRTFVQPKLDGLRCDSNDNTLTSRNGKQFVSCPHLYQDTVRLDGELYNHYLKDDFNKIMSLCRKTKPTKEDIIDASNMVEFWAYDFPEHKGVFSERFKALVAWKKLNNNSKIKVVQTYEVFSLEDIEKYHEQFISEGYEGTIIRIDLDDYENKRSTQLLKYKDFTDSEFDILGYEEGEGGRAGTIGKFWMHLDKTKPYNIEKYENVFKSNVKGNFDYLKQVWKERDSYIGKTATVKHFKFTPDGIPRFPYIIKIAREDYE